MSRIPSPITETEGIKMALLYHYKMIPYTRIAKMFKRSKNRTLDCILAYKNKAKKFYDDALIKEQEIFMGLGKQELHVKTLAESNEDFAYDRQRIFNLIYKRKS